jgi:hypothetical protein
MAIGDLYDAAGVVVGQAATFFAPNNTALPGFALWNQADPFDAGYFLNNTLTITGATSITLTYTANGVAQTTSSLTVSGLTAAQIRTALEALSSVGVGNVKVAGSASPWSIAFVAGASDPGGVLTVTPTGGTATITAPLWAPCGATDQGWQFSADKSTQTINIEEQSTPVATTITSQSVSLQAALSEDITRTLAMTLNATVAATAAVGSTVAGYDTITLSDLPTLYAVACVMQNVEGYGRIVYAPSWTSLSNVAVAFRRASEKRMYGVQFNTVCATNRIQIFNFTNPHT